MQGAAAVGGKNTLLQSCSHSKVAFFLSVFSVEELPAPKVLLVSFHRRLNVLFWAFCSVLVLFGRGVCFSVVMKTPADTPPQIAESNHLDWLDAFLVC